MRTNMVEIKEQYKAAGIPLPKINYVVRHRSQYVGHWDVDIHVGVPKIVSPVSLQLTPAEADKVRLTRNVSGIMFVLYELRADGTFKKRPRRAA